jgi:hypothetical protein
MKGGVRIQNNISCVIQRVQALSAHQLLLYLKLYFIFIKILNYASIIT